MAYNRWLTPNNPYDCGPSELYHHGVKGMKWGKHLFGKDVNLPQGGGGGAVEDPELADLAEKYKKGLISKDTFLKARNALSVKNIKDKIGLTTREELKYQENHRRAFDEIHYRTRDENTPFGKMAANERKESNAKISALRDKYGKTPLGKAEGAINKGANKVKSALRKRKQQKEANHRQFAARYHESRRLEKKERDKIVEELKQSRRSVPRSRKRRITEGGTGVKIRGSAGRRTK